MDIILHGVCLHVCARVCECVFQMYITSTIRTKSSRLAKPVLCLGTLCAAFLTGLKRVSEYRNHCSDVVAGFILGASIALFLVSLIDALCLIPAFLNSWLMIVYGSTVMINVGSLLPYVSA